MFFQLKLTMSSTQLMLCHKKCSMINESVSRQVFSKTQKIKNFRTQHFKPCMVSKKTLQKFLILAQQIRMRWNANYTVMILKLIATYPFSRFVFIRLPVISGSFPTFKAGLMQFLAGATLLSSWCLPSTEMGCWYWYIHSWWYRFSCRFQLAKSYQG